MCASFYIGVFHTLRRVLALRSRIVKEVNGRWTEFYSAKLLEYFFLLPLLVVCH